MIAQAFLLSNQAFPCKKSGRVFPHLSHGHVGCHGRKQGQGVLSAAPVRIAVLEAADERSGVGRVDLRRRLARSGAGVQADRAKANRFRQRHRGGTRNARTTRARPSRPSRSLAGSAL
jgi:hypothetical protein